MTLIFYTSYFLVMFSDCFLERIVMSLYKFETKSMMTKTNAASG